MPNDISRAPSFPKFRTVTSSTLRVTHYCQALNYLPLRNYLLAHTH